MNCEQKVKHAEFVGRANGGNFVVFNQDPIKLDVKKPYMMNGGSICCFNDFNYRAFTIRGYGGLTELQAIFEDGTSFSMNVDLDTSSTIEEKIFSRISYLRDRELKSLESSKNSPKDVDEKNNSSAVTMYSNLFFEVSPEKVDGFRFVNEQVEDGINRIRKTMKEIRNLNKSPFIGYDKKEMKAGDEVTFVSMNGGFQSGKLISFKYVLGDALDFPIDKQAIIEINDNGVPRQITLELAINTFEHYNLKKKKDE